MATKNNLLVEALFGSVVPGIAVDVHQQIGEIVKKSLFIQELCEGGIETSRRLYLGFMPFVEKFPDLIRRYVECELTPERLQKAFGKATPVVKTIFETAMRELANEESDHRDAWIRSAHAVGLSDEVLFSDDTLHGPAKRLVESAFEGDALSVMLRLAATESIAHWVSVECLASEKFLDLYPGKDLQWFLWHAVPHEGPSHQDMQLFLSSTVLRELAGDNYIPTVWKEMVGFAEAFAATAEEIRSI